MVYASAVSYALHSCLSDKSTNTKLLLRWAEEHRIDEYFAVCIDLVPEGVQPDGSAPIPHIEITAPRWKCLWESRAACGAMENTLSLLDTFINPLSMP